MFFINPFDQEFVGVLLLADRQLSLNFRIKGNTTGMGTNFMAKSPEPYNLTGNTNLTMNYSFDSGRTYTRLTFDVSGSAADVSAAKASEVATAMNANATFAALYTASTTVDKSGRYWLTVKSNRKREQFKTYISNSSAESVLRFNYHAGVAELPSYFRRHAIPANSSGSITGASNASPIVITSASHSLFTGSKIVVSGVVGNTAANATWTITSTGTNTFSLDGSTGNGAYTSGGGWYFYVPTDSCYQLIELDTTSSVDQTIITDAGLDYTTVQADYQLLKGRSGLFQFTKNTLDGSNRITVSVQYPAGAVAGDFAKKISYTYSGASTNPTNTTEIPYVLTSGDLITPP